MKTKFLRICLLSTFMLCAFVNGDANKPTRDLVNNRLLERELKKASSTSSTYTAPAAACLNKNLVRFDLEESKSYYENFNTTSYSSREDYAEPASLSSSSTWSIIGSDDRTPVVSPHYSVYKTVGFLQATFYNVLNQITGKRENRILYGTAFMVGPNVALTAGHCCLADVTTGQ